MIFFSASLPLIGAAKLRFNDLVFFWRLSVVVSNYKD